MYLCCHSPRLRWTELGWYCPGCVQVHEHPEEHNDVHMAEPPSLARSSHPGAEQLWYSIVLCSGLANSAYKFSWTESRGLRVIWWSSYLYSLSLRETLHSRINSKHIAWRKSLNRLASKSPRHWDGGWCARACSSPAITPHAPLAAGEIEDGLFQTTLQPAGQGLLHHSSTSRLLTLIFPYLNRDATSDRCS